MKQETKEVLYWCAIIACSFAFFHLGQVSDNRCAAAIEAKSKAATESKDKAATAKLDFCIRIKPPLENNRKMLSGFNLFKRIHCPERLLYADCDEACREDLIFNIGFDLDSWDSYEKDDPDDLFLRMDQENYIPEP